MLIFFKKLRFTSIDPYKVAHKLIYLESKEFFAIIVGESLFSIVVVFTVMLFTVMLFTVVVFIVVLFTVVLFFMLLSMVLFIMLSLVVLFIVMVITMLLLGVVRLEFLEFLVVSMIAMSLGAMDSLLDSLKKLGVMISEVLGVEIVESTFMNDVAYHRVESFFTVTGPIEELVVSISGEGFFLVVLVIMAIIVFAIFLATESFATESSATESSTTESSTSQSFPPVFANILASLLASLLLAGLLTVLEGESRKVEVWLLGSLSLLLADGLDYLSGCISKIATT